MPRASFIGTGPNHLHGLLWILSLVGGLLVVTAPCGAMGQPQDAPTVEAVATPNPVGTEESVTLAIRVRGATLSDIETPDPPLTRNLALQRPTPATERNVSFSDGQLTRSVTFRWTYEPVRAGAARIYPVTVTIRGEPFETATVDLEVIPQSQRSTRSPAGSAHGSATPPPRTPPRSSSPASSSIAAQDLFIRAQPSTRRVFQNEQLTVTYRLYFRSGIQLRHSRLASAWDAAGFWREELDVESRPIPRTTTLNGQSYQTIVLKRAALFPTRAGSLRVDPLEIKTEARAAHRYGRTTPFYTPRDTYKSVTRASEALTVRAAPLPRGAPATFNGAVGSFALRATLDSTTVRTGQPVRLRVHIEGSGNIATLQPPAVAPPSGVEVYDPKEQTTIRRGSTRVTGRKTFTYVLVPQTSGTYALDPVTFAYFDPEQEQYRTIRATPPPLRVIGETPEAAVSTTGRGLPVGDVAGLMPSAARWVQTDRPPLYRSPWAYAAVLAPLLALAGLIAARRKRPAPPTPPPDETTSLAAARQHMQQYDPEACYDAIERTVLGFIGQRLDAPVTGWTRPELDDRLAAHDIPPRARAALFELLDVCDQARYSPARSSEQAMESAIHRAEQLIEFLDPRLS